MEEEVEEAAVVAVAEVAADATVAEAVTAPVQENPQRKVFAPRLMAMSLTAGAKAPPIRCAHRGRSSPSASVQPVAKIFATNWKTR